MKYFYDLHIHSGLSPCCNDDMTPNNIVGMAKLKGLNIIALSDHNQMENVKITNEIAKENGLLLIPAMELQTSEDVHILCLFRDFSSLENFYKSLEFQYVKNQPQIWGNQLIFDKNDEIKGTEERLLITSCIFGLYDVIEKIKNFNGIVIPAHIDRDNNGIINILGAINEDMGFTTLEISPNASDEIINQYKDNYKIIRNSDAHSLGNISEAHNFMDLPDLNINEVINYLSKRK
jgi:PHP family Zn ribbon phosphoesterase